MMDLDWQMWWLFSTVAWPSIAHTAALLRRDIAGQFLQTEMDESLHWWQKHPRQESGGQASHFMVQVLGTAMLAHKRSWLDTWRAAGDPRRARPILPSLRPKQRKTW